MLQEGSDDTFVEAGFAIGAVLSLVGREPLTNIPFMFSGKQIEPIRITYWD